MTIAYGLNLEHGPTVSEGGPVALQVHPDGRVRLHDDDIQKIVEALAAHLGKRGLRTEIKALEDEILDCPATNYHTS